MERCAICQHTAECAANTRDSNNESNKHYRYGSNSKEDKSPRRTPNGPIRPLSENKKVELDVPTPPYGSKRRAGAGSSEGSISDVDGNDVDHKGTYLDATKRVLREKKHTSNCAARNIVSGFPKRCGNDAASLHKKSTHHLHMHKRGQHPSQAILEGTTSAGGAGATTSDGATDPVSATEIVQQDNSLTDHGRAAVLESGGAVDRGRRTLQGEVSQGILNRDSDLLGSGDEINTPKPLPAVYACRHNGSGDARASTLHRGASAKTEDMPYSRAGNGCGNKKNSRKRVWYPLNQTRRNNTSLPTRGRGPPHLVGDSVPHKTFEPGKSSSLQCKPIDDRASLGDPKSFSTASGAVTPEMIQERYKQVPYLKRHSLICTRRSSKLAKEKDFAIPLHVKPNIPKLDVNKVRKWMSPAVDTRFQEVWQEALKMPVHPEEPPAVKSGLSSSDFQLLEKHNIIKKLTAEDVAKRPSMQYLIPFTVVESDDEGRQRRRFISWTKSDNTRLSSYEPFVPLMHPAKYLHRVKESSGVKRDLVCGFYQISIPEKSRWKFRFLDEAGEVYEMCVLPMGHRCAPEIMHSIMGTIAGSSDYCSKPATFDKGHIDVYVDGVRFAGATHEALRYTTWVDRRAEGVNAGFKDSGMLPMKKYVFNGAQYNHSTHRVSLGPKVLLKLREDSFMKPTFVELEAAVGRLLYCSAILGLIIPKYHFVLKICQRRINLLNRVPHMANQVVDLPYKIRSKLGEWRNKLLENVPVEPSPHPELSPPRHNLYTDASAKGWGAILYLDNGEVCIVGSPWEPGTEYEVNKAEAQAVRLALEKFADKFEPQTCLQLWIDNTSCKAAFNRKICKSDGIAPELCSVLEWAKERHLCIKANYVSTKLNPADHFSRNFE